MIIHYMVHSTTIHNERGIASGWSDSPLSEGGQVQAITVRQAVAELSDRPIFTSDLGRAQASAAAFFPTRHTTGDSRLREMNYGHLNGQPSHTLPHLPHEFERFPDGESYLDVQNRIEDFLHEKSRESHLGEIVIISHRAPQLALEVLCNKVTWPLAIGHDWRLSGRHRATWKYTYTPPNEIGLR